MCNKEELLSEMLFILVCCTMLCNLQVSRPFFDHHKSVSLSTIGFDVSFQNHATPFPHRKVCLEMGVLCAIGNYLNPVSYLPPRASSRNTTTPYLSIP